MTSILAAVAVVAGFGFMGTMPFVADYVVIACGLCGLLVAAYRRDTVLVLPSSVALLLALAAVAATVPFVYRGGVDVLPPLALAPVLVAPGLAFLLLRHRDWLRPAAIPLICLFGAITATAFGIVEWQLAPGSRVGLGNNPIHYGGIVAIIGFMSLVGLYSTPRWWRLLFLLGPVAGLGAVLLSGSRGPMLAWGVMALVSLPFVLWSLRRDARSLLTLLFFVGVVAAGLLASGHGSRALSGLVALIQPGDGLQSALGADQARTALYTAAWHAFLSSPVVGHGYGQIIPFAVAEFPELPVLASLENLHSDLPNLAAMAGSLGVIAYLLLFAAPLMLLSTASARARPELVLGVAILVAGYVALGLTNLMFGVLPQTALYAVGLGYLMAVQQAGAMTAPAAPPE